MNWQEMEALFVRDMRDGGCSPQTIRSYLPWTQRFVEFCTARNISPASFTRTHFDEWRADLTLRPGVKGSLYSAGTVDTALRSVRAMFACAARYQKLLVNPLEHVKLPQIRRGPRAAATQGDVERLLVTPDGETVMGLRDRAVLETLYCTGLRRMECHGLDMRDLDLPGRILRVRGKGGYERMAPVGDVLAATLQEYLAMSRPELVAMGQRRDWNTPHDLPDPNEPALFLSMAGTRYSLQSIDKLVQNTGRRAGLDNISTHGLRRAYATHLMQNGAQLHEVQKLLGHAHAQTTMIYTHITVEELCQAHRDTHPRGRRVTQPETLPKGLASVRRADILSGERSSTTSKRPGHTRAKGDKTPS